MNRPLSPFDRESDTEFAPIGCAFTVTLGKMLDGGRSTDATASNLPYVRAANIQDAGLDLEDVNTMPFTPSEAATLDLRKGDILVVEGGAVGTCHVLREDLPGWSFQKTVNRLRATTDWSPRYLAYVLRAYRNAGIVDVLCAGSTIPHLTAEKLRALRVPTCRPDLQSQIADFLDRETARIDTLIEEQERLIELLRERRRVERSVRLDPHVGKGVRMRFLVNELDVRAGQRSVELPLLSVSIVWGVRRRDEVTNDEARAEDLSTYKVCLAGDLVLNRMRAFQGALGLAPEDGIVSPDYAVLRPRNGIDGRWLAESMRTQSFVGEMARRVKGIGSADLGAARTPRINVSDLFDIRLDPPSASEQADEVREMRAATDKIDVLISETERFISLARERRAALITATLTGQIDVRDPETLEIG